MRGDWMDQARQYEDTDRDMTRAVLVSVLNGSRIFLNDEGSGTDILSRAMRFRTIEEAEARARQENADKAWWGFAGKWKAVLVAEVVA